MPSESTTRVSVSRASSNRRDRSAEDRARRDTSRPKMAPTSPMQTRPTRSLNPDRPSAERPDRPRSASITSTCDVPTPGGPLRRPAHTGGRSTRCCPAPGPSRTGGCRPARSAPGALAVIFSEPLIVGLQRRRRPCWPPPPPPRPPGSFSQARPGTSNSMLIAEISSNAWRTQAETAAPRAPLRPLLPARTPSGCGHPPGAAPHRCKARAVRPLAHRHPSLPQRRPCSTTEPEINPSTSGRERARRRRRARSCRTVIEPGSILSVIAIQDHDRLRRASGG